MQSGAFLFLVDLCLAFIMRGIAKNVQALRFFGLGLFALSRVKYSSWTSNSSISFTGSSRSCC